MGRAGAVAPPGQPSPASSPPAGSLAALGGQGAPPTARVEGVGQGGGQGGQASTSPPCLLTQFGEFNR